MTPRMKKKMALAMGMCFICMGCMHDLMTLVEEKESVIPSDIPTGGNVKWSYQLPYRDSYGSQSLQVGNDGTIYLGSNHTSSSLEDVKSVVFNLQALNSDGTIKWFFDLDEFILPSPQIGPDGSIYLYRRIQSENTTGPKLCAMNPDGTEKWAIEKPLLRLNPCFDNAGTIYLITDGNVLSAINPDGTEKWTLTLGYGIYSPECVIGLDGNLYLIFKTSEYTSNRTLRAYQLSDGSVLRECEILNDKTPTAITIGEDGTIYAGCLNEVRAFNPDGTLKWSYKGNDKDFFKSFHFSTTGQTYITVEYFEKVGPKNTFFGLFPKYETVHHSQLRVLNTDGNLQWSLPIERHPVGWIEDFRSFQVMRGTDGTCYICTDGLKLFAVNPDGSWKWQFENEESILRMSMGPDGTIYLLSTSGILYAVEDTAVVGQ